MTFILRTQQDPTSSWNQGKPKQRLGGCMLWLV
jgi:hypothetical protein